MFTINLAGGVGNTMFQYAYGRALEIKRGIPVQFMFHDVSREYSLDQYNTTVNLASALYGNVQRYREKTFTYDPADFDAPDGAYITGVFQNEKYFLDIAPAIREELTLKEPVRPEVEAIAERLRGTNSVSVHVRHGDYMLPHCVAYHGVLGLDYYERAIALIKERVESPEFFIFSDDPAWCRANLPGEVIEGNNTQEDLYLLSQSRHSVIANSSYSWWGAWLGETTTNSSLSGRITVAPTRWFNDAPNMDYSDIVPSRWIKL